MSRFSSFKLHLYIYFDNKEHGYEPCFFFIAIKYNLMLRKYISKSTLRGLNLAFTSSLVSVVPNKLKLNPPLFLHGVILFKRTNLD